MRITRVLITFFFVVTFGTSSLFAQVLATGETGGKGNSAVFVSVNGLFPEGLTLFNAYGQYVYGVTDKVDVAVVYGNISALGGTQNYVGFGWNATLLKRDRAFVDVSFFNVTTIPVHRRSEASTILTTPAIIVSRPVTIKGKKAALYSGINATVPIGQVKGKLFTPPEVLWNVPAGFSTALSEKWAVYIETDIGTNLNTFGVGFLKIF